MWPNRLIPSKTSKATPPASKRRSGVCLHKVVQRLPRGQNHQHQSLQQVSPTTSLSATQIREPPNKTPRTPPPRSQRVPTKSRNSTAQQAPTPKLASMSLLALTHSFKKEDAAVAVALSPSSPGPSSCSCSWPLGERRNTACNPIGEEGRQALRESPYLRSIVEFDLLDTP